MSYFCMTIKTNMKKLISFLAAILFFTVASAQELELKPIPFKNVPAEASQYLVLKKMKAKKAKWFVAQTGVYMADFQKKKVSKTAYYFTPEGHFLYKRTPIKESDLPKA